MADREQPYDPYIPSDGAHAGASAGANPKVTQIQGQIDETVNAMRENVNNLNERGEHIDSIQHKTNTLAGSARDFRTRASDTRRMMWWKNVKMQICIIVGIIILLIVIIVPSVYASKHH